MASFSLELRDVAKYFGEVCALERVDLDIEDGEFFFLLGPSGCGKTTLLKIIGGLEEPTAGTVSIRGRDVTRLPANKRSTSTVFQEWALFPHKNVCDNIAFGMRMKKMPKAEIDQKVQELLTLIRLEGYEKRMPFELSGGQQQRVAVARALATEPDILLLDEPLSNLDFALRQQMRIELTRLHNKIQKTTIYVTHDQTEALTMADRLAVMDRGKVVQIGSPKEIYKNPVNQYVATFIGEANEFEGTMHTTVPEAVLETDSGLKIKVTLKEKELQNGNRAVALLRPEHVKIVNDQSRGQTANEFGVVVDEIIYFGSSLRLYTYFEQSKEPLFFDITADTDLANRVKKRHRLTVGWPMDFALCYSMHETKINRGNKNKASSDSPT